MTKTIVVALDELRTGSSSVDVGCRPFGPSPVMRSDRVVQLTGLVDRNNQRDSAQHGVERLAGVRHVNNRIELASRQAILTWVGMAAINLNHFVVAGLTQSVLSAADAAQWAPWVGG